MSCNFSSYVSSKDFSALYLKHAATKHGHEHGYYLIIEFMISFSQTRPKTSHI